MRDTGSCKHGDKCLFSHDEETLEAAKKSQKYPPRENAQSKPSERTPEEKAHIPCRHFKQGKCYRGAKCQYHHAEPSAGEGEDHRATAVRLATACPVQSMTPYFHRVMIDTGSNEVIRPFQEQWWNEIVTYKQ